MLKSVRAVCLVALVCASSVPALAQQSNPAPATPQASPKSDYMNQVVCQKQEVLGSRLATKRVCRTRAEWADVQLRDRQELERAQTQPGYGKKGQ